MPYRAMIWTIVTVGLALAAVTLYIAAVGPMVAHLDAAAATMNAGAAEPSPEKALPRLVQGTMLLSFLLICLLLIIGFAATFREWVRFRTVAQKGPRTASGEPPAARGKTPYVDAWKLAGERLQVNKGDETVDDETDDDDPPA